MPMIEVEGTLLFCRRDGSGTPVVMVHSTACSSSQWDRTSDVLAADHEVICPDLYGHGRSPAWPGHRAITLRDEAAVVLAAMRTAPGPVHLVGHSYGGAVALKAAAECPRKVATLTIVEPAAFFLLRNAGGSDDRLADEIGEVARAVVEGLTSGARSEGMRRFVDYWNGDGAWSAMPEERRAALSSRMEAVALNFAAIAAERMRLAELRQLDCPTLIVRGDRSPATTQRISGMLAEALPEARAETVVNAGHMLPLTHREAFEALFFDHIGRQPISRRAAA